MKKTHYKRSDEILKSIPTLTELAFEMRELADQARAEWHSGHEDDERIGHLEGAADALEEADRMIKKASMALVQFQEDVPEGSFN